MIHIRPFPRSRGEREVYKGDGYDIEASQEKEGGTKEIINNLASFPIFPTVDPD